MVEINLTWKKIQDCPLCGLNVWKLRWWAEFLLRLQNWYRFKFGVWKGRVE